MNQLRQLTCTQNKTSVVETSRKLAEKLFKVESILSRLVDT